jgi:hypothetical protein
MFSDSKLVLKPLLSFKFIINSDSGKKGLIYEPEYHNFLSDLLLIVQYAQIRMNMYTGYGNRNSLY